MTGGGFDHSPKGGLRISRDTLREQIASDPDLPCEAGGVHLEQREWSDFAAGPAQRPVLRCDVTGNPCGTDTWAEGQPCTCAPCTAFLRIQMLEAEARKLINSWHDLGGGLAQVERCHLRALEKLLPPPPESDDV